MGVPAAPLLSSRLPPFPSNVAMAQAFPVCNTSPADTTGDAAFALQLQMEEEEGGTADAARLQQDIQLAIHQSTLPPATRTEAVQMVEVYQRLEVAEQADAWADRRRALLILAPPLLLPPLSSLLQRRLVVASGRRQMSQKTRRTR